MANAFFEVPVATNEPVLSYAPGSAEKAALKSMLKNLKSKKVDIPMYIGGEHVFTKNKVAINPPHERKHVLGHYSQGTKSHVKKAISAALAAKENWANMPWQDRAAIF